MNWNWQDNVRSAPENIRIQEEEILENNDMFSSSKKVKLKKESTE